VTGARPQEKNTKPRKEQEEKQQRKNNENVPGFVTFWPVKTIPSAEVLQGWQDAK